MLTTFFTVMTGIVTLMGVAVPVYLKIRKARNEDRKKVDIAADSPRHDAFIDGMRERLKTLRQGGSGHEGKQP